MLTPLQRALLWTFGAYLATALTMGSAPLFLDLSTASTVAGILIAMTVIIGTYWAFRLIGKGFFRRALVIWIGLSLLSSASSVAAYSPVFAPGVVTSALAQNSGVISEPSRWNGPYLNACKLISGHEQFSQDSGYGIVSYGRARAFSDAFCTGIGYIRTETLASGIDASAQAKASIWFIDESISVPSNGGPYSKLSILLEFSINGWQATRDSVWSYGRSSVTMTYSLRVVRDDGYQEVNFSQAFDGAHSFGGEYEPAYSNVLVDQGHSYSLVVAFNVTSSSTVVGPLGMAHSWSCYQADSICAQTPVDFLDSNYCSQGVQGIDGKCFDIQWEDTSYNITA